MSRTWLLTGASGLLGHGLTRHLAAAGQQVLALRGMHPVDVPGVVERSVSLEDLDTLSELVHTATPDVVVHAAALTNVDACERDEARARLLHADVSGRLAEAAAQVGAAHVLVSTDHLWDGTRAFVTEDSPPSPLNAYARTKLAGEKATLAAHPGALVMRTNFFGHGRPWRNSLSDWIEQTLRAGAPVPAFDDVWFTPIALNLLTPVLVRLVDLGASGVLHVAGRERLSKYDFALRLAARLDLPTHLVHRASVESAAFAAPRPRDMSLDTSRAAALLGAPLPSLADSLEALVRGRP